MNTRKSCEKFKQINLDMVQPLLILCQDGAKREVLNEVITHLEAENKNELLSITRSFAGLVFKSETDQKWLAWRFAMLRDYLREHSWTYQETVQEGREEGLEEGRVLTRQNIEAFVQKRFPTLLASVKKQIENITDLATLQNILFTVGTARSAKEVKDFLSKLP
jgi:predicted transposase YdaD